MIGSHSEPTFENATRESLRKHFGLNLRAVIRLSDREVRQIATCRSDAARRLLLGISRKSDKPIQFRK